LYADNTFLKQLIEKRRDFYHGLHLQFVDYVTALGRVTLWDILYKGSVQHHLFAVVKNVCKKTKISCITNSVKVFSAEISLGVRQRCGTSPI
jgi:hypothetical protein